ncbi:hypothetical protein Drose_35090 [Dactylosporangium roseum]|uniref:Uncharacterized protein n=1 Tax=Dactylosporangium roseum TaxID=47989 RepID=A0ABY5Z3T1_9ACTN|nr:hypothetical protein [Dactylosporangium roseum]UWZ36226.1 hypothetical protein Drose_35090 [Dactylosporangium roseum]
MKTYGEFVGLLDWIMPLRLSWVAARELKEMVLLRCGSNPVPIQSNLTRDHEVDQLFAAMAQRAYDALPSSRKGCRLHVERQRAPRLASTR